MKIFAMWFETSPRSVFASMSLPYLDWGPPGLRHGAPVARTRR